MSGRSGNARAYVRGQMKEGKLRLLVQMSVTGDPAHSETPNILSLMKDLAIDPIFGERRRR